MRIDAMNQVSQIYSANRTKKTANSNALSFADTLELSQAGKALQVAKAAVAAAPEVREDRIAQIKAAMENGTWSVSDNDLADKLLDSFDI
ncbi:MAG: flagellar biosynthesis anti-sigma factor FlgM [Lachnospiraceae bacterium]|nr:flagellar biosynthesis anti-sigma factor FlgM [Lachnospiraceae bacterium]MBR5733004.1 flagellar biosynthesis anti-sigma factor FlgM [Lachnospiraceae bacterium]